MAFLVGVVCLQAFAACESCKTGPLYKGFSLQDDTGYFAQEFDRFAPAPGIDWDGNAELWFANAYEKGWAVKSSPWSAKVGSLVMGFDQRHNVWLGIVRAVDQNAKVITFATWDKGKSVLHTATAGALQKDYQFIGYIWPERAGSTVAVQQVSMEEAVNKWRSKEALFIDVRTAEEYRKGHVPGAISIPLKELETRLKEVPADRTVLLICWSGKRSAQANQLLQQHGFTNTYSVVGGQEQWREATE